MAQPAAAQTQAPLLMTAGVMVLLTPKNRRHARAYDSRHPNRGGADRSALSRGQNPRMVFRSDGRSALFSWIHMKRSEDCQCAFR